MPHEVSFMKNSRNHATQPFILVAVACLLTMPLGCTLTAFAQAPAPDSPQIEARAHALLAKLTLDEKIKLLGGVDGMFTQACLCHRPAALQDVRRFRGGAHLGTDHRLCRRRGAGRHLGSGVRAQTGRRPGPRCPRPRRQLPARPRRQHRTLSAGRPQLRISFRGSLPERAIGGSLH